MTQRTILITGCSTGIGLEAAKTLKHRGWRVIGTARKAADRAHLETSIGIETVPLELGDLASVAACAEDVSPAPVARLDALYNNAAYGQIGAMEDITGAVLRRHFDVNVIGTHELTRLLIPTMRNQGHGRIVTCSSVLGLISGPYRGPYCATKFAVEAMTDALRYELQGTGIHVSLLEPGPIVSNFLDTTHEHLQIIHRRRQLTPSRSLRKTPARHGKRHPKQIENGPRSRCEVAHSCRSKARARKFATASRRTPTPSPP